MREQSLRFAAIAKNVLHRFELCGDTQAYFLVYFINKGITFSFRDTALSETSFEVMRREVIDGSTVGVYKSIALIDSDSSMTFSDTEAAKTPGSVWDYTTLNIDSDAYTYTVPWSVWLKV